MLRSKTTWITLGILFIIGVLIYQYWMSIPKLIDRIKDPIHPNRTVIWEIPDASQVSNKPVGQRPPNIIVILADDLGYNDITLNGGGVAGGAVPTPAIDSIAKDGVNLRNGYSGNATCAPSRASLMTGKYPTRFGFEFTPAPMAFAKSIAFLSNHHSERSSEPVIYNKKNEDGYPNWNTMAVPQNEVMLPRRLKESNYHTLFLGKWHLGGTPTSRPEARGFDEILGFTGGAAMYLNEDDPQAVNDKQEFDVIDPFLWANLAYAVDQGKGRFAPNEYLTDYLGNQASRAIAINKDRPFFMYLAFNAPHTPLQALKSDYDSLPQIKDHTLRVYAAMIKALDRNVGKVLSTLKENGLEENTLVIFTSDNGGAHYIGLKDINQPYRGWKATFFEGGIHVPFFMKWPNQIPKGTQYDKPIGHVDIFATAAAAGGVKSAPMNDLDGVNLLPYIKGQPGDPHKSLFWRNGDSLILLQNGYKLQIANHGQKVWLFNMRDDPTEQRNLADTNPQKVAELKATVMQINAEQKPPLWQSLIDAPIAIDHSLATPLKRGEEFFYYAN
jgi:arylsulfatase A-like enzyme